MGKGLAAELGFAGAADRRDAFGLLEGAIPIVFWYFELHFVISPTLSGTTVSATRFV
jgi:hypothetical protein